MPWRVPNHFDHRFVDAGQCEQFFLRIPGDNAAHAATGSGQGHLDIHAVAGFAERFDAEVIDQSEIDNIHRDLRVITGFERIPELLFEGHPIGRREAGSLRRIGCSGAGGQSQGVNVRGPDSEEAVRCAHGVIPAQGLCDIDNGAGCEGDVSTGGYFDRGAVPLQGKGDNLIHGATVSDDGHLTTGHDFVVSGFRGLASNAAMLNPVWTTVMEQCADRERVGHYLTQLRETVAAAWLDRAGAEEARIAGALFSGSQALSDWVVAHPEEVETLFDLDRLRHNRQVQGLKREIRGWLDLSLAGHDYSQALLRTRAFKQREWVRIAIRDLARLAATPEVIGEISNAADAVLDTVHRICWSQITGRFGLPYHLDAEERWQSTTFAVLGLGKLGGHELNYSSDVDLMFVYAEEGYVFKDPPGRGQSPGKGLSNHQFFQRLIEAYIGELTRLTAEGALFRVDLRLRPEGNAGPLARSLASYESYYAQWGQTWERMMLIKARGVAGDSGLAAEFLEMVQPFRYPRSLGDRIFREVAETKARIENEVVRVGEIERNVKLGRGGIREIEFIVQTLQILHAGRLPFLQQPQTLPALGKLVQYRLMSAADAEGLEAAYRFLRDVEHRLQMENNLQTHTLPTAQPARERLARLMGSADLKAFDRLLSRHTKHVRCVYDHQLKLDPELPALPLPPEFEGFQDAWRRILSEHSFRQVDQSLRLIETFIQGPGYVHVSPRTSDLARQLMIKLLDLCPFQAADGTVRWPVNALSDPDRVMARLDSYIAVYGARSTLYEAWAANPLWFELLVLLFDRSEFLAEIAIRTPDLIEELVLSGQLRRRKTTAQVLDDLQHGREDEDQCLWLRRYHQAELMRLGLRDILGLADFEQNLTELTGLADACLQYALEIVMRRHKLRQPPFVIIGFGKLGGSELTYGSDLDITFVTRAAVSRLPALQGMAAEVSQLLASPTEFGVAFPIDTRLRPDGEKGLLVNTLGAYEKYYRHRAMLWEIQALSRTRPIAGDLELGKRFQRLAGLLTNFKTPSLPLAAFSSEWRAEIDRMRGRIERERTPPGKDPLAIKTGAGGLVDVEFIAQALCLAQGWQEANTLRALERARDAGQLPAGDAAAFIAHYCWLRRVEGILRRWSFVGETVMPDDPAPLYRVAVRCGFRSIESFQEAVAHCRASIRLVYLSIFRLASPE
jgi:[glutamine synthetase] adenylyltransferase / [glutamine synthetase]-adenylyl-L-tyrosine phosphorylase